MPLIAVAATAARRLVFVFSAGLWLWSGIATAQESIIARFEGTTATTLETFGGTEREQAFEFDVVGDDHLRLTLTLHWAHAPATNLHLELYDAASKRLASAIGTNATFQIVTLERPAPGRYRAVVTETRSVEGTPFHLVAYGLRRRGTEPTACESAYANLDAQGRAVQVASNLSFDAPGTLIFTFVHDAARDEGARAIAAAHWLDADTRARLRRYEHLPILALPVASITPELVASLVRDLTPAGLLNVEQDRPLALMLDSSTDVIDVPFARNHYGLTGRGVGMAIIDSGIDTMQGDFANVAVNVKLAAFAGTVASAPNTDTTTGHGTHVASIAGGTGARSNGRFTGVAPGATMLGLGAGDGLHITAVLEAWNYVLDPAVYLTHNVRVTNNSYGSGPGRFNPAGAISMAAKRAYDKGMISVFASGNDGDTGDGIGTVSAESVSPCVIGVAAGKRDGTLANFSSRGIPGDPIHKPDLTAPGYEIAAARASTGFVVTALYPKFPNNDPNYVILNGTSMAAPHVAGVVALLLESDPTLTFEQVLAALEATAQPMFDASGRRYETHEAGAGYVDALAAIAHTRGEPEPERDTGPQPGTRVLERFTGSVGSSVNVLGVSMTGSSYTRAVEVPDEPDLLEVRVRLNWPAAAGNLDLSVVAPDGSTRHGPATATATAAGPAGDAVKEVVFEGTSLAGRYTVQVRPRNSAPTSFEGAVTLRRPE